MPSYLAKRPVVKLSGSLFQAELKHEPIRALAHLFTRLYEEGCRPIIVAGGGEIARRYINSCRKLGGDEATLDELGIAVTRLNAQLLASAIGRAAYPLIPVSLERVVEAYEGGKIVVCGGLSPGQSTNATAAIIAERIGSDLFVNTTDVEGVYDMDPKAGGSKLIRDISTERLFELLKSDDMRAGSYDLMDLVALKVIQRSNIPTRIVKCSVDVLEATLRGEPLGTSVV